MEPELRGIAKIIIDEYLTADQVRYFYRGYSEI